MFDIQPWDWVVCMLISVAAIALLVSAFPSVFNMDDGDEKTVAAQSGHHLSPDDSIGCESPSK